MNHRRYTTLTIVTLLLMITSSASSATRLKSIELCTDVGNDGFTAINVVQSFTTDILVIHGITHVEDTPANCTLKGVWVSVDAISIPNYEIDSAEVKVERKGSATGHFSLSRPTNGWPTGNYRLDIYADSQLLGSKNFPISATSKEQLTQPQVTVTAQQDNQELQKKLQALQTAKEAGILSESEYQQKKAAIEAQLQKSSQKIDADTLKRLEALEAAYRSGILNEQEYKEKKAILLGTQAKPPAKYPPAGTK